LFESASSILCSICSSTWIWLDWFTFKSFEFNRFNVDCLKRSFKRNCFRIECFYVQFYWSNDSFYSNLYLSDNNNSDRFFQS
jgi:hypothetical protein